MSMNKQRVSEILAEKSGCVTELCQALRWQDAHIKNLKASYEAGLLSINQLGKEVEILRERLKGKPNWDDVPAGYDWIAQDKNGDWHAYSEKPAIDNLFPEWLLGEGFGELIQRSKQNDEWESTLEQRQKD